MRSQPCSTVPLLFREPAFDLVWIRRLALPGIGDAITTLMALYIVREARAFGAPRLVIGRTLLNVAVDGASV